MSEMRNMTTLKASVTRIPPDVFSRVAYQGERIRIERRGGRAVYLIGEEDMALLEHGEDAYWAEEGRKALEEFERSGKPAIPWEKVKEQAGL